jgi:hypothetical protein
MLEGFFFVISVTGLLRFSAEMDDDGDDDDGGEVRRKGN